MNEVMLILSFIAGVGLGVMFFGGLWWTLRKGMTSPRPALWFASSLLLRMGLTLLGFYVVSAFHWQRLVACLLGFAVSRFAVTWLTQPSKEASHAAHS